MRNVLMRYLHEAAVECFAAVRNWLVGESDRVRMQAGRAQNAAPKDARIERDPDLVGRLSMGDDTDTRFAAVEIGLKVPQL